MSRLHWVILVGLLPWAVAGRGTLIAARPAAAATCVGDCDSNGDVTVDELMIMVNVALGDAPVTTCTAGDANGDGRITINEIITAVNSALHGCPQPVFYRAPALTDPAGPQVNGTGVLPNGRIVTPAGHSVMVETLPLNLQVGPGGHVFVTNDGFGDADLHRYLQVIDPQTLAVQRVASQHFFGLAVSPDGRRIYVANGPADRVDVFAFDGQTLTPMTQAAITFPEKTFPMGLALSSDGTTLYAAGLLSNTFWRVDLASGSVQEASSKIGNFPYAVVVAPDGEHAYVSSWGLNNGNSANNIVPVPLPPQDPNGPQRSSVAVLDIAGSGPPSLATYIGIARAEKVDPRANIFGGSHPSAMALSADGQWLYVTATNLDRLSIIDTTTNRVVADVDLNVFGDGLQGLYPDALALSADGSRLYVADAGINAVQVLDIDPTHTNVTTRGFIPTGWYPSALGLSPDGGTLYVASAKGLGAGPNGGQLVNISMQTLGGTPYYIGRIIKGMVSAVDLQTVDLAAGEETVQTNNGFLPYHLTQMQAPSSARRAAASTLASPVPLDFGDAPSAQIQYVAYILKENRTYDQVLGDLTNVDGTPKGNGEPRLTLFGADITPNTHALAQQFAMGDNFYDDAEVSYPGHEWVTQGDNNDFVEKIWPFEYNNLLRTPFNIESGQEGFCKNGYIFEALDRQGVSYRVYGEPLAFNARFAAGINGGGVNSTLGQLLRAFGSIANLTAHINDLLNGNIAALRAAGVDVDLLTSVVWPHVKLDYPSSILADKTDVGRAQQIAAELQQYTAQNDLPHFLFIWLPNDHTFGAAPNMPTPDAAVADNDRGMGMVVDALSHSPFWSHMAIFVTEDDAQDGQDHVSAHRTLSLVISPYAKRGYVSAVHASNVGMLKTMELLLGVQPMSQYDRYATDMRDYFTTTPDPTPFTAVPARVEPATNPVPAAAANPLLREAAVVSQTLNFSEYDEAGPQLSRVLWLVHVGNQVQRRRRLAAGAATLMLAGLIGAGILVQRRRIGVRASRGA